MADYKEEFTRSLDDPAGYWAEQANQVSWFRKPSTILTTDINGNDAWFVDGELNSCYLAVDVHVEQGRGSETALIYDSPVTDTKSTYSFIELRDEVARFAGVLQQLDVRTGDRVIIYMPMIPEAVIAMLACARIGAIHSVVFGGFAARELSTRIDDATPKVILCASCGIEFDKVIPYKPLIDEALNLSSHQVEHCVVYQRTQCTAEMQGTRDKDWMALLEDAVAVDPVPLRGDHPLYILYTSGTTGKPKGVVRDNAGHAVAMKYSLSKIYNVEPGEVFWAASDVGWVVGHSYIVYGPLFAGCTTILFEGKPVRTPDAGTFWRIISDYKVSVFFTAPTAFRAIRKEDPEASFLEPYDVSSLRTLFVAGERTDPATYEWLREILGIPVVDHWWQTESGWPIAADPLGIEYFEPKAGSACLPVPGFDVQIVSESSEPVEANEEGDVVVRLPLPPGCLPTVWGDHQRYVDSYLSEHRGFYHTGDGGYVDDDGFLFIMGRTDDVINVAGHRLSTGQMEEVVASHPAVAECAVIGIEDREKGQIPAGMVIIKDGVNVELADLQSELVAMVRKEVGAFANFRQVVRVNRLPKTRSGKILRQVMRRIVDVKPFEPPATIDDPVILDEIADVFRDNSIGMIGSRGNSEREQ
jgi:propionyl-CoA synthetase